MSGEITWSATSTDLDRDAYAKALDANAYVESDPRGSTNYEQWVAATYEDRFGWPYEDHVRLLEEIRSIELVVSDDPSDENRNAYLKASQALADFVNHSCAAR